MARMIRISLMTDGFGNETETCPLLGIAAAVCFGFSFLPE